MPSQSHFSRRNVVLVTLLAGLGSTEAFVGDHGQKSRDLLCLSGQESPTSLSYRNEVKDYVAKHIGNSDTEAKANAKAFRSSFSRAADARRQKFRNGEQRGAQYAIMEEATRDFMFPIEEDGRAEALAFKQSLAKSAARRTAQYQKAELAGQLMSQGISFEDDPEEAEEAARAFKVSLKLSEAERSAKFQNAEASGKLYEKRNAVQTAYAPKSAVPQSPPSTRATTPLAPNGPLRMSPLRQMAARAQPVQPAQQYSANDQNAEKKADVLERLSAIAAAATPELEKAYSSNAAYFKNSYQKAATTRRSKFAAAELAGQQQEAASQAAYAAELAKQEELKRAATNNAKIFKSSLEGSAQARREKFARAEQAGQQIEIESQQAYAAQLKNEQETAEAAKINAAAFKSSLKNSAQARTSKFARAEMSGAQIELESQQAYADELRRKQEMDYYLQKAAARNAQSFKSSLQASAETRKSKFARAEISGQQMEIESQEAFAAEFEREQAMKKAAQANANSFKASLQKSAEARKEKFAKAEISGAQIEMQSQAAFADQLAAEQAMAQAAKTNAGAFKASLQKTAQSRQDKFARAQISGQQIEAQSQANFEAQIAAKQAAEEELATLAKANADAFKSSLKTSADARRSKFAAAEMSGAQMEAQNKAAFDLDQEMAMIASANAETFKSSLAKAANSRKEKFARAEQAASEVESDFAVQLQAMTNAKAFKTSLQKSAESRSSKFQRAELLGQLGDDNIEVEGKANASEFKASLKNSAQSRAGKFQKAEMSGQVLEKLGQVDMQGRANAESFKASLKKSSESRSSKFQRAELSGKELESQTQTIFDSQEVAKVNANLFKESLQKSASSRAGKFSRAEQQGQKIEAASQAAFAAQAQREKEWEQIAKDNAMSFKRSLKAASESRVSKFQSAEAKGVQREIESQQAYADKLAADLEMQLALVETAKKNAESFKSSLKQSAGARMSAFQRAEESGRQMELESQQAYALQILDEADEKRSALAAAQAELNKELERVAKENVEVYKSSLDRAAATRAALFQKAEASGLASVASSQVSSQEQNSKIEEVQSPPLEQTKDMFFAQTQTSYRPKPPTTPPPAIFDDQFEDATIDFFQDDKQASVDTSNEVNQSATQEKPEKPWWQFWD